MTRNAGVEYYIFIVSCSTVCWSLFVFFSYSKAGIPNKVGYAFGLGLERWAMQLYEIPDIRLFWSKDEGFLNQFITDDIHAPIKYKVDSRFSKVFNVVV